MAGIRGFLAGVAAVLLLASCASSPSLPTGAGALTTGRPGGPVPMDKISPDFRVLTGWGEDHHGEAMAAFQNTCAWVRSQSPDKPIGSSPAAGRVADWRPLCDRARLIPASDVEAARLFFETHFQPVTLSPGEEGLFTGYYETELHGSWTRSARYNTPLYRLPPKPKNGYPDRAAIARGALAGKGLELMWVDDPISAFFLEIQGSGRVVMEDGSVVGVGYAGKNGHAYYPVGRRLIDMGVATPEQMSLQVIRAWMTDHPDQRQALMNLNPSYVFFNTRKDGGARGARNMELTAGRSLAVDPSFVPLGVPLWLEARNVPVTGGQLKRLVVAQDTGGAIRGAVRGDLFWGHGPGAEEGAGVMKARGRYTMLVPRSLAPIYAAARTQ